MFGVCQGPCAVDLENALGRAPLRAGTCLGVRQLEERRAESLPCGVPLLLGRDDAASVAIEEWQLDADADADRRIARVVLEFRPDADGRVLLRDFELQRGLRGPVLGVRRIDRRVAQQLLSQQGGQVRQL